MKLKELCRNEWKRITKKEVYMKHTKIGNTKHFRNVECHVVLINVLEVVSPLIVEKKVDKKTENFKKERIIVLDSGYKLIEILPKGRNYCITANINEKNQIVQWYFDILDSTMIKKGVPYFYDLYLDLIIYPDGNTYTKDKEELKEALRDKSITLKQFLKAKNTLYEEILPFFKKNIEGLNAITIEALGLFEK